MFVESKIVIDRTLGSFNRRNRLGGYNKFRFVLPIKVTCIVNQDTNDP